MVDSITGPLSYNPNSGVLSCTSFTGTVSGEIQSTQVTQGATFSAGNLSIICGFITYRSFTKLQTLFHLLHESIYIIMLRIMYQKWHK